MSIIQKIIIVLLMLNIFRLLNGAEAMAQTPSTELKFDSLIKVNEKYKKKDFTKLKLLNNLALGYPFVNPTKGIEIGEQAVALAQKIIPVNLLLLAEAYNNKALNHAKNGEYPKAIELYEKAIAINQGLNNQFGFADNTCNIGDIYDRKGYNKKAKECFEIALTIFEALKDKAGIAKAYHGFGNIYFSNEPNKALEYLQKALGINLQLGNKSFMAANLANIGGVYFNLSDYTKAMYYYQEALAINVELGNKSALASNLGNIGIVYGNLSEYYKALEYNQKAFANNEQLGNKSAMANNLLNIGILYSYLSDYPKALEHNLKARAIYEQFGNKSGLAFNLFNTGCLYSKLTEHPKALEYFQKALVINEQLGNKGGMADNLSNLGAVYNDLSNFTKALEYYQKALAINEQMDDKTRMELNLGYIRSVYSNLSNFPKAFEYCQKELVIYEDLGNKRGMANTLLNIGSVYIDAPDSILVQMGVKPEQRFTKALEYQNKSLQLATEIGEVGEQKEAWKNLSITYEKQGNFSKSHSAYKKYIELRDSIESGEIKQKIKHKTTQSDFDKKESELKFAQQLIEEKLLRSTKEAALNKKQFEFDLKESELKFAQQLTEEKLLRSTKEAALNKQQLLLSNKEKDLQHLAYLKEKAEKQQKENLLSLSEKEKQLQQSILLEVNKEKEIQEKELSLSKAEVKSKNLQRNGFIIGSILLLLLAFTILIGLKRTSTEKKKSDKLLLNILPAEVAEELKAKGSIDAKQYHNVTVLFTDFVNFTGISEQLSPTELVKEIHKNFTAFDAIMEKHGLEKIKTIGDAYLAVCGLPIETFDHAQRVVFAAQDIQKYLDEHTGKFQIRIGIHSGSVVAGIVGVKKFAYDIWGDTVNMAARMEQNSEVGQINISQVTFDLVKTHFNCIYRSKIQAKNKGEVDMYFVQ